MKLAIFSPYGSYHREAGLMYLVANYLLKQGAEVTQFRCDGAFTACGRDRRSKWNRTLFTCSRCTSEQSALSRWASCRSKEISSFVLSDDVLQAAKWIHSVKKTDLWRSEFRGLPLWDLVRFEYLERFGGVDAEAGTAAVSIDMAAMNADEEAFVRELYLSAVHMIAAADRFSATTTPSLHLLTGGSDTLTRSYTAQLRSLNADGAVFSYDESEQAISIESLRNGARYDTKLVLDDITAMRSDPRTWAPEVTAIVHEMLTFLGFAPDKVL